MATIVLVLAAGAQFAMPSAASLPAAHRPAASRQAVETARLVPQMYHAVMAHPIFAPDRAPPPAEADAAGNLNGVEVLGIAIAGHSAAAALLRDSDGAFSRVKVGEEIEGWKLLSIQPQQLVFDRNGERRSLAIDVARLKTQSPAGPTKPSATGAPGTTSATTNDSDDTDDSDDDQ